MKILFDYKDMINIRFGCKEGRKAGLTRGRGIYLACVQGGVDILFDFVEGCGSGLTAPRGGD